MAHDPFAELKAQAREGWAKFAGVEVFTTPPAGRLVRFAGVAAGEEVLDVATGTGVVAVTAAVRGARVQALDLSPVLLERARQNASLARVSVDFREGDAEALPYPDASFDVVLSQFGHMFAPRPEVAIAEMLRVLRPGGRIAFCTWPPEHVMGRLFALVGQNLPSPPGAAPPVQWGDPNVVRERLGAAVEALHFSRAVMTTAALSVPHLIDLFDRSSSTFAALARALAPEALAEVRRTIEALFAEHFEDNALQQHYLLVRARKAR